MRFKQIFMTPCKVICNVFRYTLRMISNQSNLLVGIATIIISICSLLVTKNQADLAAISLYPHFQVIQQTDDTDSDGIHDLAYITVNNLGGNFYAFECSLASFFKIHDYNEGLQEYFIPVDGLFVVGVRSFEQPVIYTKKCNQYLNYNSLPIELENPNCYYDGIQTYVKITYQNINLDTKVEYFDSRTGRRLSAKEGAYYFDRHLKPKSIDEFYSSHRPYAGDTQAIILNKINGILCSEDTAASALLIPIYQ